MTDGTNQLSSSLINQPFFANFNLASGVTQVPILDLFLLPTWDGLVSNGNDLAILSLLEPAPSDVEQYDIYRDMNELGQTFTKVGYGNTGNGFDGDVTSNGLLAFFGQNQFEGTEADLVNLLNFAPQAAPLSQLLFDFDSGYSFNNLIGSLGLGRNEVNTANGDSGGRHLSVTALLESPPMELEDFVQTLMAIPIRALANFRQIRESRPTPALSMKCCWAMWLLQVAIRRRCRNPRPYWERRCLDFGCLSAEKCHGAIASSNQITTQYF